MNKLILLSTAGALFATGCLLNADDCDCKCKHTSHTFFSCRPHFQTATPERIVLFRNAINEAKDGHHGGFEAVVYGSQSEKNEKLARFFSQT